MNRRTFLQAAIASSAMISFRGIATAQQRTIHPAIVPPDRQFMASLPRLMELARLPGLGMAVVQRDKTVFADYVGVANAKT